MAPMIDQLDPADMRCELLTRVAIHTELVSRILAGPARPPEDLAMLLEDVGNAYLDLADSINAWLTLPARGRC